MKNILLIYLSCMLVMIFRSTGFCEYHLDPWKQAGFSQEEREKWLSAGFKEDDSDWAEMYRDEGVAPREAIKEKKVWEKAGYERSHTPHQWKASHFTIDEAMEWKKAGFENPFLADNYRKAGFGCKEAKKWSDAVRSSFLAKQWKSVGFTPTLAGEWSKRGYSPQKAKDTCISDASRKDDHGLKCP